MTGPSVIDQLPAADRAVIDRLADAGLLGATMDAYLQKQPFREDVVRTAIGWVQANAAALVGNDDLAAVLAEAIPGISEREMLSVALTLRVIATTARGEARNATPTRKRLGLNFSRSGVPLVRDASPEEIMRRSTS